MVLNLWATFKEAGLITDGVLDVIQSRWSNMHSGHGKYGNAETPLKKQIAWQQNFVAIFPSLPPDLPTPPGDTLYNPVAQLALRVKTRKKRKWTLSQK